LKKNKSKWLKKGVENEVEKKVLKKNFKTFWSIDG
jgi:hypothetical protein